MYWEVHSFGYNLKQVQTQKATTEAEFLEESIDIAASWHLFLKTPYLLKAAIQLVKKQSELWTLTNEIE